jgi:hypothetical protein
MNDTTTNNVNAVKHDAGKPRMSLLLTPGGVEVARALTYGAGKYSPFNYRNGDGLDHSRLADAALRHIAAYLAGEDLDPESGLPHLAHAGASINMLLDLIVLGRGKDDRWRGEPVDVITDADVLDDDLFIDWEDGSYLEIKAAAPITGGGYRG